MKTPQELYDNIMQTLINDELPSEIDLAVVETVLATLLATFEKQFDPSVTEESFARIRLHVVKAKSKLPISYEATGEKE